MAADSKGRKRPRMSLARRGAIALGLFVSTWPAGALARSVDYRWTSGRSAPQLPTAVSCGSRLMRRTVLALVTVAAYATSAHAETDVLSLSNRLSRPTRAFAPLLGKRFVAECRMDYCQWLRLESASLIGRSP